MFFYFIFYCLVFNRLLGIIMRLVIGYELVLKFGLGF